MTFKASEAFWKNFYALSPEQKESVREKWKVFKNNQFHASLGTHRIIRLSALHKSTVYSVVIEGNLRVIFKIVDNCVFTIDIGTHDIYK
jgi:hypothetical protein